MPPKSKVNPVIGNLRPEALRLVPRNRQLAARNIEANRVQAEGIVACA
jgi:hypothetical protein